MKSLLLFCLAFLVLVIGSVKATEYQCPGLPDDANVILLLKNNNLLWFSPNTGSSFHVVQLSGVSGQIQAIDVRPRGRTLFGLSNSQDLYSIDLQTGAATRVSNLSEPLIGSNLAMDFNPTVDRLRLTSGRTNFRVNVDNGLVTVDGQLQFANGDFNQGRFSPLLGAAYTNNTDGATVTTLYGIYAKNRNNFYLVTVNPPNNGTINTIGNLEIRGDLSGGFDIYTSEQGCNTAVLASNGMFWFVDLATGTATPTWTTTSRWLARYLCDYNILGLAIF